MTIRNEQAFLAGVWDWGILRGCFGQTKIEPTDIDGLVERNGKFLYFEAKSPGAPIPTGQEITFKQLLRDAKNTIMIVWGEKDSPERLMIKYGNSSEEINPATLDDFRRRVQDWFIWADSRP